VTLIHTCRHPVCCPAETSATVAPPRAARKRFFTIDLHCHMLDPATEKRVAGTPQKAAEPHIMLETQGAASVAHNQAVMLPNAIPKLTQLAVRLADMDEMGVDVQVISPSPTQYYYWADAEMAHDIVRLQNEAIADACAKHPTRLAGLGNAALQHPQLACEQITHAVKTLGLKGIEISSAVNGLELSDPSLRSVWACCEELGALVFIHPLGTTLGARIASHYLVNTIGQPLETTVALSHLIFGGVLDHHPGLRIVAAHGGGYLPTYISRSDHAYAVRPEASADTRTKPSDHLRRIWFDSLVYEPMSLRHLIDRVGVSQVVLGTDYPFDMGHYDMHTLVDATPGLSDTERASILGTNAAALINWPLPTTAS